METKLNQCCLSVEIVYAKQQLGDIGLLVRLTEHITVASNKPWKMHKAFKRRSRRAIATHGAVFSSGARMYGLRYKRRTKHLPKSTVMLRLAFCEYFATK